MNSNTDYDDTLAVGIDLGTTNSAIAYLDQSGRPITVPNAEGDKLTPSVVFFDDESVVVGKEALKAISTNAIDIAQCMKRELGRRFYDKELGGRHYPPEALEAWVLDKIRRDAGRAIGELRHVVVTVPAYFDEVRRKATQDAAYIAGLELIDIINEPTAAAIAYGYEQGFLNDSTSASRPTRLLVYDLGGGTFDVTIMEIVGREFITLATDGDVLLGGQDWDSRLVEMVADAFLAEHGVDPREDANTHGRLWRDCEDAKRTLSARTKANIPCDFGGKSLRHEVTREQFEHATRDLLDRTAFTTRQTLQAAGFAWRDIDRVLLVGGSTRMPAVSQMLEQLSGKTPDASVAADEAVAHGAALHAGQLLARHRGVPPQFSIRNVNSHSLGVVATEPASRRRRNAIIIPRNTHLPITAKRIFKTQKSNQSSVLVQIVEGESAAADECVQIGRCTVRDLPEMLPAQTPIEVRFRYLENGRLTVLVNVQGTDRWAQREISRDHSLTPEQLETWRTFVTGTSRP
ncbi:MAG: Hsp70 family protein [Planctomycetales bacterium]|nr:Hsp70 family protein [Planctomycetales bacterium]MCA9169425.1 Hsp70 family protein [Planctomycetales bacterium]